MNLKVTTVPGKNLKDTCACQIWTGRSSDSLRYSDFQQKDDKTKIKRTNPDTAETPHWSLFAPLTKERVLTLRLIVVSWPRSTRFHISITWSSLAVYQLEPIQVKAALSKAAFSFRTESAHEVVHALRATRDSRSRHNWLCRCSVYIDPNQQQ